MRYPLGGHVQAELSCLLGLERTGYEVYFVEVSGEEWEPCYDPETCHMTHDPGSGLAILRDEFERFGLGERWCYVDGEGEFHGFSQKRLEELCGAADFLFSRAGTTWREEFRRIEKRIYLDVDPAFTQMRMPPPGTLSRPGYASVHDFTDHFTLGANVGETDCRIPLRGLDWKPTYPVYVPELYKEIDSQPGSCFTTVMSWDAYGAVEWEGEIYGQKDLEFPLVRDLPKQCGGEFVMVLAGGSAEDRAEIEQAGWKLRNANKATRTRKNYLEFLGGSKAELSVCKNGYAKSNSGWFSDRTLAYLALGRPVVVQDTGLGRHLPVGRGLHVFSTTEEAREGIRRIEGDYEGEAAAAREIAQEFFDAGTRMRELLQQAGIS